MVPGLGIITLLGLSAWAGFGGGNLDSIQSAEVAFVRPTQGNRPINLTNASWYWRQRTLIQDRLSVRIGATLTQAKGEIIQVEGRIEDGSLRTYQLESSAWGLGPTANASLKLLRMGAARINLDVSGSLMFYDRQFPSGGSYYNGMVQAGPSISFNLSHQQSFTLGLRWLHISNGQGLGAHNPSFDGYGPYFQYQWM